MIQRSSGTRDDMNTALISRLGASGRCRLYTGAMPANCAAARTGTLLADIILPATPLQTASGVLSKTASAWSVAAVAAGVAGYYSLINNGTSECIEQGEVSQQYSMTTTASTAANGNALTVASTTNLAVGMQVSGTGIPTGCRIAAIPSGTSVVLDKTSTAGVANGASITFGHVMTIDNSTLAIGQTVTVTSYSVTQGNA